MPSALIDMGRVVSFLVMRRRLIVTSVHCEQTIPIPAAEKLSNRTNKENNQWVQSMERLARGIGVH